MPTGRSQPSHPLRIALVCPYSLSRPGGVQGQVVGLSRALEKGGDSATVFAPLDDTATAPTDVDLVSVGHSVSLPANGSIAPITLSPRSVLRARRALVAGRFDVVHVHEPFSPGLPYGLLLGGGIPPVVATFHRSGDSPFYPLLRPITRRLSIRFRVRCAVSEAARATAARSVRGPCEVLFNGVEVDRYRHVKPWPTDGPTIVFLGRHEERKGLAVLLGAFGLLRESRGTGTGGVAAARLWVAGDGPLTDTLRRHHPPSPEIEWLGVLSEEEKIRRLAAADVLCAPSLGGESFGMVLLEAMAARTVVVASDIDGYRDAAAGHAELTPPGDVPALAAALAGVLGGERAVSTGGSPDGPGDPEAGRDRWLDEATRRADEFAMDRLADLYRDHYRTAMVRPVG